MMVYRTISGGRNANDVCSICGDACDKGVVIVLTGAGGVVKGTYCSWDCRAKRVVEVRE